MLCQLLAIFARALLKILNVSAHAKLDRHRHHLSDILPLSLGGHIWWQLMIPLAVASVMGNFIGIFLAMGYYSGLVRWVFIAVVGVLICSSAWDAFVR